MRLSNLLGFAMLLLREKHGVFLLTCLFLLMTKVFIRFNWILFDKNIGSVLFNRYRSSSRLYVVLLNLNILKVY